MKDLHFNTIVILFVIVVLRFFIEIIIFIKERVAFRKKITDFLKKMNLIRSNKVRPYSAQAPSKQKREMIVVEKISANLKQSEAMNN